MQVSDKLIKAIYQGNVHKFYISTPWRKTRLKALERDNKECISCRDKGLVTIATCVHHKVHLKANPYMGLVLDNLVSLCDACHNLAHPEKIKKLNILKEPTKKNDFLKSHKEKW